MTLCDMYGIRSINIDVTSPQSLRLSHLYGFVLVGNVGMYSAAS